MDAVRRGLQAGQPGSREHANFGASGAWRGGGGEGWGRGGKGGEGASICLRIHTSIYTYLYISIHISGNLSLLDISL